MVCPSISEGSRENGSMGAPRMEQAWKPKSNGIAKKSHTYGQECKLDKGWKSRKK
jgi:hypothetical protein